MSWVEMLGQRWPATDQVVRLQVFIWGPQAPHPRTVWHLDVFHMQVSDPETGEKRPSPHIHIEISDFAPEIRDWRRFSGWELRADAAWREAQECVTDYNRHQLPHVLALGNFRSMLPPAEQRGKREHETWLGHDFVLRFGTRDGWEFPCEIDGWVRSEEDYWQLRPQSRDEAMRFPTEPPNLRVMARAEFVGGTVIVPRRHHADPVAWAREVLRAEIGCETMHDPRIKWATRRVRGFGKTEKLEGWGSRVTFRTRPLEAAGEGG